MLYGLYRNTKQPSLIYPTSIDAMYENTFYNQKNSRCICFEIHDAVLNNIIDVRRSRICSKDIS